MNWSFDAIFFLGFGAIALYLGFSGSRWLFWGSTGHERLEKLLGRGYRQTINLFWGFLCLSLAMYFLLTDS